MNTPAKKSRAVRRAYPPKSTIVNHCHPTKTLGPVFDNPSPLKLRRGFQGYAEAYGMSANACLPTALVRANHCIPILVTPFYLGVALAKTEAHRA